MTDRTNIGHHDNFQAERFAPQTWDEPLPPNPLPHTQTLGGTVGRLRGCSYCGSMAPWDLLEALRAGARAHEADRKYGWPHKYYIDGVPNPHAGLMETTSSGCVLPEEVPADASWRGEPDRFGRIAYRGPASPAPVTTGGKFYTVHLQDATPEEKEAIERALGLRFTFQDSGVSWEAVTPAAS